jgi:hypothetical protein
MEYDWRVSKLSYYTPSRHPKAVYWRQTADFEFEHEVWNTLDGSSHTMAAMGGVGFVTNGLFRAGKK